MDALEVFKCPMCLDYADAAVATTCCFQVYCKGCISSLPDPSYCPSCRSNFTKVEYTDAVPVQRALDKLDVTCPNECNALLKRAQVKAHLAAQCPKRLLLCPCPTCFEPKMTAEVLGTHIATKHQEQLVSRAARIFDEKLSGQSTNVRDMRLENIMNMDGRSSRLGSSGMRYCGGKLPGMCYCCDGYCGPTCGCACVACMVLELNLRKLPKGWLINNEGASCRRGVTGLMYCGRMMDLEFGDGWCGPTNGPQCEDCRVIQPRTLTWYKDVDSLRSDDD